MLSGMLARWFPYWLVVTALALAGLGYLNLWIIPDPGTLDWTLRWVGSAAVIYLVYGVLAYVVVRWDRARDD